MAAWLLLAGANAAAEDVPKKRIALEKSLMVVCIVHKAQFVSRLGTSRTRVVEE